MFAREGVFGLVDPAPLPLPARPSLRLARLIERPTTGAARPAGSSPALTRLGPTYVKLGQFLATRPDVVGVALARDLERCRTRCRRSRRPRPKRAVAAALGKPLIGVFASFGPPVAAASIAQVHRAEVATAGRAAAPSP